MHRLSSTLLGLAALFGAATSAFAGAGSITTTVTRLQPQVTYSTPAQPIYVGYQVAISNTDGNTINHIRFTASAAVTDPAKLATYDSAEGAACETTNPPANTAIECWIGQLPAGASYPTFAVFFKAPADSQIAHGPEVVTLSGDMVYAEGPSGGNPARNSVVSWSSPPPLTPVQVLLGTASNTDVRSGVPKAGGTFFTGDGVSSGGGLTTRVTVPAVAGFSTAQISELPLTTSDCTNFFTCWESNITIVGNVSPGFLPNTYEPYLTIVLRQDALNIRPGTKIGSVLVNYIVDGILYPNIGPCASPTTPLGFDNQGVFLPCIAGSVYYKNRSTPNWTPALDGDFEWTLISHKNGRFSLN